MKFNFKKITSVIASAIMLGSTAGFAAAANYPAPFISGGVANVGIVVTSGNHAGANSDLLAGVDLSQSLSNELVKQGGTNGDTTIEGEGVEMGTSSRGIYYSDAINAARTSLSNSELPNVLKSGTFTDLSGTQYTYSQTIVPGATTSAFGTSGGDLDDPTLYLNVGTESTAPLYNYTLSFNKNLNVSDATNVQGEKISILGVEYVIGASSTNSTLYLYGSGQTVLVPFGEVVTVTVGDQEHPVELITTSATDAKISVDGVSKTVRESNKYTFPGDVTVYVKDITHAAYAGDVRSIELIVGAKALKIANGATVKQGADETSIKGTKAIVNAADHGVISGFTVSVAMAKAKEDHLAIDTEPFVDPVFGGLSVQFSKIDPELDSEARGSIVIDTDNAQYAYVTFDSARAGGVEAPRLTYVYDNKTASTEVQPVLAYQTITSADKGHIHIAEGENAKEGDWIVINQGDAGTIVYVDTIDVDTDLTTGKVKFTDVITDVSTEVTLNNGTGGYTKETSMFGGTGYVVSSNGTLVNITWDTGSAARTVFPRIKLQDGGWIAFLTEKTFTNTTSVILPDAVTTLTTTGVSIGTSLESSVVMSGVNWSLRDDDGTVTIDGINTDTDAAVECNFSAIKGPAIAFFEPKKWDDSTYGDLVCIPLATTGSTEISIGDPQFSGTNSGFVTLTSDTYQKEAVDKYGTFATKEDRTNENGVATIAYPKSQMSLDVLFTEEGATSSSGNGTAILGSITKTDKEVSSIQNKNLIVIGGSCINSVAAQILGGNYCSEAFTTATGVGADQFLIKVVENPYASDKIAMVVAGYEAADTTKAVEYLINEKPATAKDTVLKKVTATYADVA